MIVAQFYGAKDKKNLNKTLHTSYAFGIVTGFVVAVVGLLVTNTVLELMKTPQELMADSRLYLHIYFPKCSVRYFEGDIPYLRLKTYPK